MHLLDVLCLFGKCQTNPLDSSSTTKSSDDGITPTSTTTKVTTTELLPPTIAAAIWGRQTKPEPEVNI